MDEQVKRYDTNLTWGKPLITECSDGDWVQYTDYAALLAERDRLQGQVEHLLNKHLIENYGGDYWFVTMPGWANGFPDRASAVAALLEERT